MVSLHSHKFDGRRESAESEQNQAVSPSITGGEFYPPSLSNERPSIDFAASYPDAAAGGERAVNLEAKTVTVGSIAPAKFQSLEEK